MKKLGLIGGTSWYSTIEYYTGINQKVTKVSENGKNPELILYSINMEVMRSQNQDVIHDKYLKTAQTLEQAGAEAIIICANTPHMAYHFVQPKIGVEILHIADAIGREAKKHNYHKLGLLGTKPTMLKGFIKDNLKEKYQIDTIIPDMHAVEKSHEFIAKELTQGVFSKSAIDFYKKEIQYLKEKGADAVILGCTELPMLLKDETIALPGLSTTDLHIDMAVDFIVG